MPELKVELHAHIAGQRFLTLAELGGDAELLRSLHAGGDDPDGGLAITDDIRMILVDDLLTDVAGFFLDVLPEQLRSGAGGTYRFRTGPETTEVAVTEGGAVRITGYDGDELHTTAAQLLGALDAARREYEAFTRLAGLDADGEAPTA